MYVCMYVCLYVAIRRPRVHHECTMRVRILQFSKDRQHRSHVNSNCSSPKQAKRTEQQREQPMSYSRERLREQPFERWEKQTL